MSSGAIPAASRDSASPGSDRHSAVRNMPFLGVSSLDFGAVVEAAPLLREIQ